MKRLIASAARHPVFPNLLMAGLLLAGSFGFVSLRREAMPDIATDVVEITVPYPGAAAPEVEEGIVVKVENALNGVQGIREVTAFAREGMAEIQVTLKPKTPDIQKVITEIRDRVDGITTFPVDAEKPGVRQRVDARVAFMLVLSGDAGERVMRELAHDIRGELMELGIFEIDLAGVRDYEIVVDVLVQDGARAGAD